MLKRPLIVGALGSMGQRYQAILRHMGLAPICIDKGEVCTSGFDSVIIASPTVTHIEMAKLYQSWPILMEKPLSTNLDNALLACDEFDKYRTRVRMVNQYRYLLDKASEGPTYYNYFRHGPHSLALDCISIIALAKSTIRLEDTSPIWTCCINGQYLSLKDMDGAYCDMVEHFLKEPPTGPETDYIREAHSKAYAWEEANLD